MERDFESEYKELKQNETPDLWNRIEAGLSDKKKGGAAWKRWGLLAAACLCVIILFPAVIMGITGSFKNSSSAADTSMADEGSMSGSMSASMTAVEAAAEEEKASDAADTTEVMESAEAPEVETPVLPNVTDGQILEGAVVQIMQAEETGEGTVYQAVVLETDADAVLESGIQIELLCNDETQYDFVFEPREEKGLQKDETYEVSLQYEQERFVVLTAAKKK